MPQPPAIRTSLRAEIAQLYPLQRPLLLAGLVAGAFALVLQDWIVALCIFTLFAMVGASWRMDMVPILPVCMGFLWLCPSIGYIYYLNAGYYPGVDTVGAITTSVPLSMLGLAAIVLGLRLAFAIFRKPILAKTLAPASQFNMRRVFWVTIAVFSVSYAYDVLPMQLWFGGAQILANLFALRFVPYFILLVTAFQRRRGYGYVVWATLWVVGPQLLTGFSTFKEILLTILIAALVQWRPWIKTPQQVRENRSIFLLGAVGVVFLVFVGLVWNGGVKSQWRSEIWQQEVTASPVERMMRFLELASGAVGTMDFGVAAEGLAQRFSSGAVFFSYVVDRVPQFIPHENGRLIGLAIANATQPRFLFPDKANLGGDSWLVQRYAGVAAAGDESGASIGLGFLAEFYIDYGFFGVIGLATLWGFIVGSAIALLAKVAPSREFFLVLVMSVCVANLMGFDGSFIKLLAGFVQRVLIEATVFVVFGSRIQKWLTATPSQAHHPSAAPPHAGTRFHARA